MEQLVNVVGDTLDTVDKGTGQSYVRIVPAELLPSLHDICSVMSYLVWLMAVLSFFFIV